MERDEDPVHRREPTQVVGSVLQHGDHMSFYDLFSIGVWVRLAEVDSDKTRIWQGMWESIGHGSAFTSEDWAL